MRLLLNKTKIGVGFLSLLFLFVAINSIFLRSPSAHAVGTKEVAKYYVNNGSGSTNWHSQGATLTKDYYIWTDWKKPSGPTVIVMCKRSKPSSCWRSSQKNYGHASTLYHKWGTDYFLIKQESDIKACWSISKKKEVAKSNCNSMKNEFKIGSNLSTHAVPQGYTRYGNYFLRSYGNTPGSNYITLYNSKFTKLKDVKLPNWVNEVEDVMVDGATGSVYFSTLQYVNGKKQVQFHKISDATFSKWIKPASTTSSSSSSSSKSSSSKSSSNSSSSKSSSTTSSTPNYTPSQSTYDGSVSTIFFGDVQDDGKGCGVYMILNLILDILTYGIGIAAVIGISISGIMYLTSKGNEANTTKAKRRIYEIVIGLAAYAVLYVALNFLLPGGNWNTSNTCKEASSSTSSSNSPSSSTSKTNSSKQQTEAAKKQEANTPTSSQTPSDAKENKSYQECMKNAAKVVRNDICQLNSPNKRLATTAKLLAWPTGTSNTTYKNKATPAYKTAAKQTGVPDRVAVDNKKLHDHYVGKSCAMYICVSVAASGVDPTFPGGVNSKKACNTSEIYNYLSSHSKKWKNINKLQPSKPQPGDIIVTNGKGHVATYVDNKGKTVIAQANLHTYYGLVMPTAKWQGGSPYSIFRYVGK